VSTATDGRAREHGVKRHLEGLGWKLIARSAASKGSADLVMAHEIHGLALIQVGTEHKHIGPDERRVFLHDAWLCSALPIVAITHRGRRPTYWQITDAPMSHWHRWQP
jgi:hypothetical protein